MAAAGYHALPTDEPSGYPGPPVPCSEVVQFSSAIYIAVEGTDHDIEIDVIRFGNMDGQVSVGFTTENGTAKAGVKFRKTSGTVTFGPGQAIQTIRVGIIDDNSWNTALEFRVCLSNPQGCHFGEPLHRCRVRIVDDDLFPTNKYDKLIRSQQYEELPSTGLIWEYCKLNFRAGGVRWRTLVTLLLDASHNFYFVLTTYLHIYMVDVVFNPEEEKEEELLVREPRTWRAPWAQDEREYSPRELTALVVALLYVVPYCLLHVIDLVKTRMDLSGVSQEYLQTNLFRKYLNYDEETRMRVTPSDISLAVIRDCAELGDVGYMKSVGLFRIMLKLTFLAYFVHSEHSRSLPALIGGPVIIILWACCRTGRMVELLERVKVCEKNVVQTANDVCKNYRLMADYSMRPAMNDRLHRLLFELHSCRVPYNMAWMNSIFLAPFLTVLSTGAFIALVAPTVIAGELSMGSFLAIMRILHELGMELREAYVEVMEVLTCTGALQKITGYMNGGTDLFQMRKIEMAARQTTWEMRTSNKPSTIIHHDVLVINDKDHHQVCDGHQHLSQSTCALHFNLDNCAIDFDGARFRYTPDSPWIIDAHELKASQGTITCIIGPQRGGKSTLLRLLAKIVVPQEGQVFIPTHLRVLHVTQEPMLFDAGLWENVTFGNTDNNPARVFQILERLDCREPIEILKLEQAGKDPDHSWSKRLASTDLAKVHLARAFIANAEVLILHRPCIHFDGDVGRVVLKMIQEHKTRRGVEMPLDNLESRRPRTCFYTTDNDDVETTWADQVWEVTCGKVREVNVGGAGAQNGHQKLNGVMR